MISFGIYIQLEKNREEIQFERKSKKLTMFMSYMDISLFLMNFVLFFPPIA